MLVSLQRMATGFAVGAVVALVFALVAGLSRLGEDIVDPLLQILRMLPLFGLVPVFIVSLGLRAESPDAVARVALGEVGLAGKARAWPLTLSGGEAQRAALARALVREPSLLLLDEPFSALDALTRIAMHALVLRLWQLHRPAVLLVTHDVDEALILADHPGLIELRHRLLAELGVTREEGQL